MSFLKITALTGVVCLAAFLGYKYVTADPPGYCGAQQRYISDAEFIKAVGILVEGDMKSVNFNSKRSGKEKYVQWDKEWNDLNPRDPKFSTVERKRTHSIFNRIFDLQRVDVRIGPKFTGGLDFHFDVCGKLVDSDVGLPATSMDPITTTTLGGKS